MKHILLVGLSVLLPGTSAARVPVSTGHGVATEPVVILGNEAWAPDFTQWLELPRFAQPRPFSAVLDLGARHLVLELAPHSDRAPGSRFLVDVGLGEPVEVPVGPSRTYRGTVEGVPGSRVAASLDAAGSLSARVQVGPEVWWVQPAADFRALADPREHYVYSGRNAGTVQESCGVDLDPGEYGNPGEYGGGVAPPPLPSGGEDSASPAVGTDTHRLVELAVDMDYDFYEDHESDVSLTVQAMFEMLNIVNLSYEAQFNVTYQVTALVVRTLPGVYTSNDNSGTFCEMFDEWGVAGAPYLNEVRDQMLLLTGRNILGAVGVAYTGGLCSGPFTHPTCAVSVDSAAYTWCEAQSTQSLSQRVETIQHEFGHLWGAPHGDCGCTVMCPTVEPSCETVTWTAPTIAVIEAALLTKSCVAPFVVHVDWTHSGSVANGTEGLPFPTVLEGLLDTVSGDHLHVAEGVYDEGDLVFDKRMTIVGESGGTARIE